MKQMIEMAQVAPEQLLELSDGFRRIVTAQPPEPVGTFADGELRRRRIAGGRIEAVATHHQIVALFGGAEQIPGGVLVLGADPSAQRAIDPTAGGEAR